MESRIESADSFFARIDYVLLKEQMEFLSTMIPKTKGDKREYVEGILSLLEAIQDLARQLGHD